MAKKSESKDHFEIHDYTDEKSPDTSDLKDGKKPVGTDENVDADSEEIKPAEEAAVNDDMPEPGVPAKSETTAPKAGLHHSAWGWVKTHKKVAIPAAVLVVLAVIAAVPFTRYFFAGMVVRKDFTVTIVDSQTNKPVTSASVTLAGKKAVTDSQGKAKLHVNVGSAQLTLSKKYYKDKSASVLVAFTQKQPYTVEFEATGRPVQIVVVNKVSNKPAANVTISAENTQAITDSKGEATLVVPADKATVKATLSGPGYNKADATLKVTASIDPANKFTITPAGKLYFLSNASGTLDVVKSDLDGQNRQLVLPGTGKEDKVSTVLLASRDWKYVALLSKRDGGDNAKLFLIETATDKLTTMDEGDATFSPYGWSGSHFVYGVERTKVNLWQPKRQALKSYDASTGAIASIDQTTADGDSQFNYRTERIDNVFILDKEVVYTKTWQYNGPFAPDGRQATFNSSQADGSQHKVVKGYPLSTLYYLYVSVNPGDFNEIYIRYTQSDSTPKYDSYQGGKLTASDLTDEQFNNNDYHTFIVSPSGNKTFWTEFRDGKNVFFVGDGSGKNGKQLPGSSDDYAAYGWYSDDYLLVTKKSSEMYIMPVDGLPGGVQVAPKVSDYYKPNYLLRGYGYGYGG
ncbi:MAG TPA: hypothetical protein VGO07_07180 [Candidatus Saccharimonadales bacterium]|jgi:hypothetical protein|nr:hypothetical protein [Candidatus Saccharimonadales bacterium]